MHLLSDLPPLFAAGLALAFVLLLIWLGARLAPALLGSRMPRLTGAGPARGGWRRRTAGRGGPGARLARQESLALGPRHCLHLIRCDERDLLLMTGGAQDIVIGWLPAPRDQAEPR